VSLPRTEIASRVESLVRDRLRLPAGDSIDENTGLLGHGIGLDSIEVLQLVAGAEEAFGITVSDDELLPEHFETIGTFVTFIETRIPS
jgi:acyl carrier protein